MNDTGLKYAALADQAQSLASSAPNSERASGWTSIAGSFWELADLHRAALNRWRQKDERSNPSG